MTVETKLAKTTDRKDWYRYQIEHYIKSIPLMQVADGSFCEHVEPQYKPGENARLQEGILPLAWHMHRFGTQNFRDNIVSGVRRLLKMQLEHGAYPETDGESFTATAFITFALSRTLAYTRSYLPEDLKNNIQTAIKKSLTYLMLERDVPYTNQLSAALLALKEGSTLFQISDSILRKKLNTILSHKDSSGLFKEGEGVDLGYSTLTYSLLSTFDDTTDYYKDFIDTLQCLLFPDGTHVLPMSRTHGWIILNALESASRFHPDAEVFAQRHIGAHEAGLCDATHLISRRHILTTLYRLCEAYDNCQKKSSPLSEEKTSDDSCRASKHLKRLHSGRIIALFYLGKNYVGYSFYLGPNRILFGSSQKSVLIEKRRRVLSIKSSREFIFRKSLRRFEISDDSLVLNNMSADNPIFSVGPLIKNGQNNLSFWKANQNMFHRENVFKARLQKFKIYRFHYEG